MKKSVGFNYQNEKAGGAQGYIIPRLIKVLEREGVQGRILDIGCGNGSMARTLATKGYEVWGCEWDAAGVEIANRIMPGKFMRWDLNDSCQKFPWGNFQAVISSEVIEHLFLPKKLFELSRHALTPGGLLIVTTPYHGYWKNLALCLAGKWDRHHDVGHDGGHIKFFSVVTLRQVMREGGFAPVAWCGCGRLPGLWKSMLMWGRKRDN